MLALLLSSALAAPASHDRDGSSSPRGEPQSAEDARAQRAHDRGATPSAAHRSTPAHSSAGSHRPTASRSSAHHAPARHAVVYRTPPRQVVVRHGPPPRRTTVSRAPQRRSAPQDTTHDVSLTLAASHLAVGMIDATAEFGLGDRASFSLIGGVGRTDSGTLYEAGAAVSGYFVGDFDRGLSLGLQVRATNANLGLPVESGAAIGPTLGGKYTFDFPLTLTAQIGGDVVNTPSFTGLAPNAKLSIGFSF